MVGFRSWSNVVTVTCITIAGIIEAWQEALSNAPKVSAIIPALDGAWHYVPLGLLIVGGVFWAAGHIFGKNAPQSVMATAQKVSDLSVAIKQAEALGCLPIYRADLEVELLGARRGNGFGRHIYEEVIFLELRIVAKMTKSLLPPQATISTALAEYECLALASLEEWILIHEYTTTEWPGKNSTDAPMKPLALWDGGTSEQLAQEIHRQGWVALLTDSSQGKQELIETQKITKIVLRIEDGSGYIYKFRFRSPIPECLDKIAHNEVRRLRR